MVRNLDLGSRGIVLCSENKGADQLQGTALLICAFAFAYAKGRSFHDVLSLICEVLGF